MTYVKQLPAFFDSFKDFDKFYVGFDDQFQKLAKLHDDMTKNIPNYPPYNIKKVDENVYVIEVAVAGFSKSELEIEFADDKLIVRGNAQDNDLGYDWLYRGIAARNFTRTFALNDQIEIKGADLVNGMLKIALERIIPEHKKPKKIDISEEPSTVSTYAKGNKTLQLEEYDVEQVRRAA
jgi:molecular chaperone IbpA